MEIRCESRIDRVVVHARGALVTRAVDVPARLPDGDVDLVVAGLTILARPGSLRAAVRGSARSIVFAQLGLHVPAVLAVPGRSVEKVRAIERRLDRLRAELSALQRRRTQLEGAQPRPSPRTMLIGADVPARVRDGLAAAAIVRDEIAAADRRLLDLAADVERLELERSAAQLEDAQTSGAARQGAGHPSRQATVRVSGSGLLDGLELTYAVPAARWWPKSTLRLTDGGAGALWTLEALVAQASGEDWRGCKLGLSTADLNVDARLPELASMRFGRAQRPRRTGYRPAPEGLAALFAHYDRSFAGGLPGPAPQVAQAAMLKKSAAARRRPPLTGAADAVTEAGEQMPEALTVGAARSRAAAPGGAAAGMTMMLSAPAALSAAPPPPPEPKEIEPAGGWMDFDALSLKGAEDPAHRGRLLRVDADPAAQVRAGADAAIEGLSAGARFRDPERHRGRFDHRYDAAGLVDVPADGVPHRVTIGSAPAQPSLRLRTVPREAPDVFREAELRNPFDAPLLAGPVDVYVEGSLLTITDVEHIDRGGTLTVGMGVEDRVRVARNARADEESAGVFGGSVAVTHSVTIDLTSSLGREIAVEVIDRVPVSDEKTIEIAEVREEPRGQKYDQSDRGEPIRGGRIWKVALAPGGKARIEHAWRVVLPAKDELVGGNRRE